ncbi:decarboxylating 6-phosphogluconate dehydrogenase [Candidatus Roizmanbacteria bacterium]|nr:decarboxylating 6-phosphogluconate dehydrogenase [Candidatus Roizmanbacteria bacterium]
MRIGFIGLGKMGSRMVEKLRKDDHEVFAWNRSPHVLKNTQTLKELVKKLEKPRVVWIMVTAGEGTQNILDEASKYIEKEDIVIDGGNAYFRDTQTRFEQFQKRGIRYLGVGVSGGIIAEKQGYPLMVGGDKNAYEFVKRALDSLSKPNGGHEYFGEGGAGHFVKMVHNGMEYGIMQSLGEGFGVLEKSPYNLNLLKVAKLYQKGTLVSGFMLDRAVEVLTKDPKLSKIIGVIGESGEGRWTVEQAKEEGVEVEVIEKSLAFRKRSQKDSKVKITFAAKLIAALRNAFGGHEIKKSNQ